MLQFMQRLGPVSFTVDTYIALSSAVVCYAIVNKAVSASREPDDKNIAVAVR